MNFPCMFCFVVDHEDEAGKRAVLSKLVTLLRKLSEQGIDAQNCPPGQRSGLICPTVSISVFLTCLYVAFLHVCSFFWESC